MFDFAKIEAAVTKNGAGMVWGANDVDSDSSHILEHVREKYMHGALIRNAAMWRNGDRWENCIRYWGIKRLRDVVRQYLNARLGLAR